MPDIPDTKIIREPGDIDGNGQVDEKDLLSLSDGIINGDMNGDDKVDETDRRLFQQLFYSRSSNSAQTDNESQKIKSPS